MTGLGHYFLQVLFEKNWRADWTFAEAKKHMETCMHVMFQRDKKAIDRMQITTITKDGINIGEPYKIESFKHYQFHDNRTNEFFRPARISPE